MKQVHYVNHNYPPYRWLKSSSEQRMAFVGK